MNKSRKIILPLLDEAVDRYNRPNFIENDPITIPHSFSKLQDIEIMGFWTAMLAWGQRVTIIRNARRLIEWMDYSPHQFILQHSDEDLRPFTQFVHRTFNATDALYFIHFFKKWYSSHSSLEEAFQLSENSQEGIKSSLIEFHNTFFNDDSAPHRTKKHVATPLSGSSCKRLNMFLRWMVRKDDKGVDFGLWNSISPADLICPLDIHVGRVARHLGILERKQNDWKAAIELTEALRTLDPTDPVKYDFALFGLGLDNHLA